MPEPLPSAPLPTGEAPTPPIRRWGNRRVRVEDQSMLPTLQPGDRLLVDPRAYRDRPPRVGEIVILVDPEDPARWLVKRVRATDPARATVEVRGDAPEFARDSRGFGPVPTASIVGRVVRIYFPLPRRRNL